MSDVQPIQKTLFNLTHQWAWNCSQTPDQEQIWMQFDDDTSLTIELQFMKFIKTGQNHNNRSILIGNLIRIDIQGLYQQRLQDPTRIRRIKRISIMQSRSIQSKYFTSRILIQYQQPIDYYQKYFLDQIPQNLLQVINQAILSSAKQQNKFKILKEKYLIKCHIDDTERAKKVNHEVWKIILKHLGFFDFNEVDHPDFSSLLEDISKPDRSQIFDGLFFLYSMESFVFEQITHNFKEGIKEMEKITTEKDECQMEVDQQSKLNFFYLAILITIRIELQQKQIENLKEVYRAQILEKKQAQQLINDLQTNQNFFFRGLVSTSQNKELIMEMASQQKTKQGQEIIIFRINLSQELNCRDKYINLDKIQQSYYYQTENEFLLADGIQFCIQSQPEKKYFIKDNQQFEYTEIILQQI